MSTEAVFFRGGQCIFRPEMDPTTKKALISDHNVCGTWTFGISDEKIKGKLPLLILEAFQKKEPISFYFKKSGLKPSKSENVYPIFLGTFISKCNIKCEIPQKVYRWILVEEEREFTNNNLKIIMAIASAALLALTAIFVSKPIAIGLAVVSVLAYKKFNLSRFFVEKQTIGIYNADRS